jgi:Uma2 family endonuclease
MTSTAEPRPYRWTRDEYYKLSEAGFFQDRRVQLIDGEIIEMSAQLNVHAASITLTQRALDLAFGPSFWVRVQMTLDLSPVFVPDPDLAVVPGSPRGVTSRNNPTTALLIVEVSDSSLGLDRNRKGSLYAQANIADYWIVNLVQRQLEVYRNPIADPAHPYGFRYADRTILDPGDSIAPLAAPQANVAVADLLP